MNRLLSLLTTITLLINTLSILAIPVSAATVSDFAYQNYSVKYTVKSEKVQTKAIEITLKNTGTEAMYSWALGFDATGKISGLKGAEVYGSEETSYILKNTDKNFELAAGKSVVISYTLTGAKIATPKVFELMSHRVFAEGGFEAKLHRDDKKIETFEGGVTVTNTGETPIEAWALSFDANFEITKLTSGKTLNFEDKRYTISNTNRQTPIAPGESFEIAFSAKNSAGVTPKIENVTLTKVEITAKEYANVPQIEAWAEYEEGTLTLKWESSLPVGKFTLYESSDDKTYTKRIELKNKFEYIYKYAFEKRYFKIAQTRDGITSESIAFVVEKTTDPVTGAVTFVSARPDADGDGLENYIEDILGTDREKADTDNDGLTDYEEVYLSGSDPLKYDSIKAGVSDANADADEDGLNTKREIQLGTNPLDEDSDYDGLDDGAEVNTHHTNPLKSDTDGDFIPDGDELALGLNPNSATTNGIPDNQRTTAQTIGKNSESLQYINSKSDIKFSLQINAAGLAENSLSSGESGYAAAMNNPAIIGAIPEFTYTDGLTVSEVTIAAEISASNVANTVGTYAELNPEFEGIKRLNFFRYFEEINTLLPVETTFDISKNMMYTKTDELGTYCIMDMEIWLDSLGGAELLEAAQAENEPEIEQETEPEQQAMRAFSADNLRLESKVDVQPLGTTMAVSPSLPGASEAAARSLADPQGKKVIFFIENTDEFKEHFELAKDIIVRKGGSAEIFTFAYEIRDGKQERKYDVSKNILEYLNGDDYDKNAETYIFLVFNEKKIFPDDAEDTGDKDDFRASENSTAFTLLNKLNLLGDKQPNISVVYDSSSTNYDPAMFLGGIVDDTGGCEIDIKLLYSDRVAVARAIINHLEIQLTSVKYLSSVDLVPLPQNFDSIYIQDVYDNGIAGKIDYDVDGLNDYSEIAFDSDLIDFSLSEPFPTLARCKKYVSDTQKLVYVEEGLSRFMDTHTPGPDLVYHLSQIPILPINSDPTLEDGDGDGLLDGKEIIVNSIKVAPKDNEPLRKTPQSELWKHHISEMSNGYIPRTTVSIYNPSKPAEIGSYFGDMKSDYKYIVHANVIAWQKGFGYNNVYDTGLFIGDWGRMRRLKLPFNYAGKEYIIWAWRGDYINLGAGAELGIYVNTGKDVESTPILKEFTLLTYLLWGLEYPTYQYSVVDFYLPMTLHLYQEKTSSEYNTVYNWAPIEEQWWITGFEPQMLLHDPSDLTMICSIDFSENVEMYNAFKYNMELEKELLQYLIFDDDKHTVWIIWGDGSF